MKLHIQSEFKNKIKKKNQCKSVLFVIKYKLITLILSPRLFVYCIGIVNIRLKS